MTAARRICRTRALPRLEEGGEVQDEEERDQVRRDKHERKLGHRGGGDAPGEPGDEARAQRPGAHGDGEIQDPEEIPDPKATAAREGGLAEQGLAFLSSQASGSPINLATRCDRLRSGLPLSTHPRTRLVEPSGSER